ncbi:HNH endonuclease [Achromobacter denitrificans]|uniref:HNH endonuclease n=1 Tax=Achromobacter denitrificans TaxID=32002 RepID=UPI0029BA40E0|nr:HNH endonuclease [Achromobacter sp.]
MNALTQERLKAVVSYDADTGVFRWKVSTSNRVKVGAQAGFMALGYVLIGIDGKKYAAHRLAFLYMTGTLPTEEVDHRNGVRDDNRFSNLRLVSHEQNMQNEVRARHQNKSGFLGVSWVPGAKAYRADISMKGKTVRLGTFPTAEEAHAAYVAAKRQHHAGSTL